MPALVTAEGDPMVFGKVSFDVLDRAHGAAALDGHGELSREEDGAYAWIEEAEAGFTRSLGHILLEDDPLDLEVTSRQRAERGRRLIGAAAGSALRHRTTRLESVEKALERAPPTSREAAPEDPFGGRGPADPRVQGAQLRHLARRAAAGSRRQDPP